MIHPYAMRAGAAACALKRKFGSAMFGAILMLGSPSLAADDNHAENAAALPAQQAGRSEKAARLGEGPSSRSRFGPYADARPVTASPSTLCQALAVDEAILSPWQRTSLPDQSWECFVHKTVGTADASSSLFAVLRGGTEQQVGSLRLKLNLTDEETARTVRKQASGLIGRLYATLDWPMPASLAKAVERLTPFRDEDRGTEMRLYKEYGDVPRYNVMLDFPEPVATLVRTPSGTWEVKPAVGERSPVSGSDAKGRVAPAIRSRSPAPPPSE